MNPDTMTVADRVAYGLGQALGVGEEAGEFVANHLRGLLGREPTPKEIEVLVVGFRAGVGLVSLREPADGKEV